MVLSGDLQSLNGLSQIEIWERGGTVNPEVEDPALTEDDIMVEISKKK